MTNKHQDWGAIKKYFDVLYPPPAPADTGGGNAETAVNVAV